MSGYIFRRLLQSIIVVLGVTLLTFVLQHILPGNLAREIIGARATPALISAFDTENGLNHPLIVQYFVYLGHLLHGNLGYSYHLNESVANVLAQDLPKSVLLVGIALVLALVLAIGMGLLQAVQRNRPTDHLLTVIAFTLYAMPSFALGLVLIQLFAVQFHWFPGEAPQGTTVAQVLAQPSALVLPVATLTLFGVALFSRYMRASGIEVLLQDYVRTARAKGIPERAIIFRHVLRNALTPVVTLAALSLPGLITAGLVVEFLFNYPGTGLAYFNAAVTQDYPVMLGITLVVATTTAFANLAADLGYALLDPRIRYVKSLA